MFPFSVCRESGIGFDGGGKLFLPKGGWPIQGWCSSAGGSCVSPLLSDAARLLNRKYQARRLLACLIADAWAGLWLIRLGAAGG
jgi:hypothetical protein